jgi:flagellar hook protein FlgE
VTIAAAADRGRVYASSVSGIRAADLMLSAAADDVANLNTEDYRRWRVDLSAQTGGGVSATATKAAEPGVDLVDATVSQITGSVMYQANARTLERRADTDRHLLDVLA